MARRRGFFAELQYQQQLAEKQRLQAERAQARAYAAAVRQEEQARKRAERAAAQLQRATLAQRKEAEREAKRLRQEARLAEVEALNAELGETYDAIDSLLDATLDTDDYVDLEGLRIEAEHPPFARPELEIPAPPPQLVEAPKEPVFVSPEAPTGFAGYLGKKKHAAGVAEAREAFAREHQAWQLEAAAIPERQLAQIRARDEAERARLEELEQAQQHYEQECRAREAEVAASNGALDGLITRLGDGQADAVQEYVGIVLSNAVYPEAFPIEHDFEFDPGAGELTLTAVIPSPDAIPATKAYRYVKAKDEIATTALAKGEVKRRYSEAVTQVALRTLHEVFEADRAALIGTIALVVVTDGLDQATGRKRRTRLVAVGAERDSFLSFDLQNVVPAATLKHLGASISKSPIDLVDIDPASGVRSAGG